MSTRSLVSSSSSGVLLLLGTRDAEVRWPPIERHAAKNYLRITVGETKRVWNELRRNSSLSSRNKFEARQKFRGPSRRMKRGAAAFRIIEIYRSSVPRSYLVRSPLLSILDTARNGPFKSNFRYSTRPPTFRGPRFYVNRSATHDSNESQEGLRRELGAPSWKIWTDVDCERAEYIYIDVQGGKKSLSVVIIDKNTCKKVKKFFVACIVFYSSRKWNFSKERTRAF